MPTPSVTAAAMTLTLVAASAGAVEPAQVSRTFSIIAIDPDTGTCGAAVASKYPAVGKVVPAVKADVGAFVTQHYHVPKWRERAIAELALGSPPEAILGKLLQDDPQRELRQLAVIDMAGRAAVHNPSAAGDGSRYWGAMTGRNYSVQGNTLTGREVIAETARAFEETKGTLADRLIAALVAGDCAGGDHRGRLAAGIRVAKKGVDGVWLELDVDNSDDAVIELAKKYAELKHEAKGDTKPFAHPCRERKTPEPPK